MKRLLLLIVVNSLITVSSIAQIVSVQKSGRKYGFINDKGEWVVMPQYDYAYWNNTSQLGKIQMFSDNKCGVIDKNGKIIVPREYDHVDIHDKDVVGVTIYYGEDRDQREGVYSNSGKLIIPCEFKSISIERNGIRVENDHGYKGVYSKEGDLLLNVEYAELPISPHGTYNFLNKGGSLEKNGNGFYEYAGKGKWGACDSLYRITIPCEYDGISGYGAEDIISVNRGGECDAKGKTVGGKWGYWGGGREIFPCQYDEVSSFSNGVATVKKDGTVQLIKNPLKVGSQIQIAGNASPLTKKERGPVVSRYPAPDSDVDKNIPTAKAKAENSFAFIICNENYPDAPVPYSLNDGRMFKEYCQKALGLPAENINLYEDATFGNIITAVEKMKQIAEAYDGEANIIFYYAGHGFPDEKQATAYLLPIDGNASDITTTGYSLAKFYQELSKMKLKSSIVFLDACFSGAKREDQMLSQARGVAIKVKEEAPQGNMLVFSAAQGDETAHQMEEKHHGLFTYYLLKELQAAGGDVDMGTLTDYVTKQVKRQSVVINNKKQTPTVIPSQALANSWRSLKLRK